MPASNGPRVSSVVPVSGPRIVPLSVVLIRGTNFAASDQLQRVIIGGREAEIVQVVDPNSLTVVVPIIAPGTANVVREEDMPRNFRIIPPKKGVAGITHNMNRLNLVLGEDGKTITWAFWE